MTGPAATFPEWLRLREPADAAARSHDLVDQVRRLLPADHTVVHDLGSGTGSMGRWLARLLPGPQHWVLHDRDADLLALAAAHPPTGDSEGAPVSVETRRDDITRLDPRELEGARLVTASALLDMLTEDELDRLVSACAAVGVPTLIALTVTGHVELTAPHPLDVVIAEAFNAHQRRPTGHGPRLGPDAVGVTTAAFRSRGLRVLVQPSPWRLGADDSVLIAAWLRGWVGAATEQRPELARLAASYTADRLAEAATGVLQVTVHHQDLLALPV